MGPTAGPSNTDVPEDMSQGEMRRTHSGRSCCLPYSESESLMPVHDAHTGGEHLLVAIDSPLFTSHTIAGTIHLLAYVRVMAQQDDVA